MTEILGRKITHKVNTPAEHIQYYVSRGYPEQIAGYLVGVVQGGFEKGTEEALWHKYAKDASSETSNVVIGKETLKEWIERHKEVFVENA